MNSADAKHVTANTKRDIGNVPLAIEFSGGRDCQKKFCNRRHPVIRPTIPSQGRVDRLKVRKVKQSPRARTIRLYNSQQNLASDQKPQWHHVTESLISK